MPGTMNVIAVGDDKSLSVQQEKRPSPGEHECLIRVHASGVNRGDLIQRAGFYPSPKGASPHMGLEASGTVEEVGGATSRYRVGDRVCCILPGGGYAEYAVVDEGSCLPLADGLSFIQGASLAETMMTVWTNVFDVCALKPEETLLVHGGTSGIGVSAIQMAKELGAKVAITAGSDDKCAFASDLGADLAINYKTEDFVEKIGEFGGADVILDMVGADYVARNLSALNKLGRLVNIAYQNGSKVEIDLMPLMLKRLTVTGSTLRSRSPEEKRHVRDGVEKSFWKSVANGRIKPVIYETFPFSRAADAHDLMKSSKHIGKIVLVPDGLFEG